MSAQHTVEIVTRDGKSISFESPEDLSLLEAAEKAGIRLPSSCRSGACGACTGKCTGGDFARGEYSEHALHQDAADQGFVLTCRTYARSAMTIEVPADLAHITAGPVPEQVCEITAIEDLGGQVMRLCLKSMGGAIQFEPGQFMELFIPGSSTSRAYSMSNAPNWAGELEFLIRLQPGGKFSTWLKDAAEVGKRVITRGPQGSLVLQSGGLNPRRFVAGGTGLAPMLSMLRHMAALGETNDVHLYLGVNTEDDLFGSGQLDDLRASLANLRIDVCVWKASDTWDGFAGTPVDALHKDLDLDLQKGLTPEIYICGPPGLVDATEKMATDLGVPISAIYSEKFLPS